MSLVNIGVVGAKVALVSDEDYPAVLLNLIAASNRECFCNMFIIESRPGSDPNLSVISLLMGLAGANWRGVDVRLLIGGSRSNLDIALVAELARAVAGDLKIPCRWLTAHQTRGSHAKWVVADDWILIGSHNWSPGAFAFQTQDSVLLKSDDLAAYLCSKFESVWQRAGESSIDVSP